MLNITITEQTPHNMLRAIRAACNELLGDMPADLTTQAAQHVTEANRLNAAANSELDQAAASLSAHNNAAAFQAVPGVDIPGPTDMLAPADADPSVERDSAGAEWNPELHASTKAKNQDGTWKKRRGASKESLAEEKEAFVQAAAAGIESALGVAAPALPPLPPAPPAAPLVTMNDIYALIQNHKCVLNDVIAAAQAMGFADVGAFSRDATPEQRAQLLAQLTKEVA